VPTPGAPRIGSMPPLPQAASSRVTSAAVQRPGERKIGET
jgi:hypothetical protein